ncbi:MAG: Fructose-bisphosphate aldolase class-I [Pseudonocardiales bacterium]|nr:Fructose-bisphosphate aldolase class-I [Pseudonocardiales bacterium]
MRQDGRRLHSVIDVRNRRDYRALLLTTPGLDEWVSGIILSTETLGQQLSEALRSPLRYAALCQAAGIVAIVEPEVPMGVDPADGDAAKGLTRYRGQGLMSSRLLFHRPST